MSAECVVLNSSLYPAGSYRRRAYLGTRPPRPVTGRAVVLVYDGVATWHMLLAILDLVRQHQPARLVVAVPVVAPEALRRLRAAADEVVCLLAPADF